MADTSLLPACLQEQIPTSLDSAKALWSWWTERGRHAQPILLPRVCAPMQPQGQLVFGELELHGCLCSVVAVATTFRWKATGSIAASRQLLAHLRPRLDKYLCTKDGRGLTFDLVVESRDHGVIVGPGLGVDQKEATIQGLLDPGPIPIGGYRLLCVSLYDFFALARRTGLPLRWLYKSAPLKMLVALDPSLVEHCSVDKAGALDSVTTAYCYPRWPLDRGPARAGPGYWQHAIKVYRFSLSPDNEIEAKLVFIATPRIQQLASIAGVAPIFGPINLLARVKPSWGRALRNFFEARAYTLHVAVHDSAIEYARQQMERDALSLVIV